MSSVLTVKQNLVAAYFNRDLAGFRHPGNFSVDEALSPDYPFIKGADGFAFSDINYASEDRSAWSNPQHLARLFLLSMKWYGMEEGERKEALFADVLLPLLDLWLNNDYKSSNWWYNEICTPTQMGQIGVFLFDRLDDERRSRFLAIMARGAFGPRPELMTRWTGANLLWFAFSTIQYALVTEDADLLQRAIDRAGEEIAFGDEGIQKDGSFFQHGHRLYSCGYGLSFLLTLSDMIFVLGDTPFQFSHERLAPLYFHLLDGIRYMTQGAGVDYCTNGREYTRRADHTSGAHAVKRVLTMLARVPGLPRRDEVLAFLDAINEERAPADGVHVFADAMFLCSHAEGIYIGVRGMNPGLVDEEICNSEGILGYNLSYGTHTTVMKKGDEYRDITPLWDYARMPGTTARYESDEELLAHDDFTKRAVTGNAFGCEAIADCGYIVMDFEHETVSGKFAALATPFGTVLLGRDFRDSEEAPLFTTAEQCFPRGEISLSADGKTFVHNGVCYEMLDGACAFTYEVKETHGNWHRNNLAESDADVVGDVLTLSVLREGCHPHYAYVICPEKYKGQFALTAFGDVTAVRLPDGRVATVDFANAEVSF